MIRAKFEFTSNAKSYVKNLEINLQNVVRRSALMVRDQTVMLLNKSGKSAPAKSGMNVGSVEARKAMPRQAGLTRNDMKSKGLYWYGEPLHRWVEASQPGTPPHKQTGTLQRSITTEINAEKTTAKIGPTQKLVYARHLELGGKMAARPYLLPAFKMMQDKIQKLFADTVRNTNP